MARRKRKRKPRWNIEAAERQIAEGLDRDPIKRRKSGLDFASNDQIRVLVQLGINPSAATLMTRGEATRVISQKQDQTNKKERKPKLNIWERAKLAEQKRQLQDN